MANIVSAVFDNRADAQNVVDDLRGNGIPEDAISIVARSQDQAGYETKTDAASDAGDAGKGALTGAGIGAGVGALFGLAAAMIPGVGPFITAGALASALGTAGGAAASGAIVGATSGGLAGALSHWGLNEADAQHYADEVERGGTFVGVDCDQAGVDPATVRNIFSRYNANFSQRMAA